MTSATAPSVTVTSPMDSSTSGSSSVIVPTAVSSATATNSLVETTRSSKVSSTSSSSSPRSSIRTSAPVWPSAISTTNWPRSSRSLPTVASMPTVSSVNDAVSPARTGSESSMRKAASFSSYGGAGGIVGGCSPSSSSTGAASTRRATGMGAATMPIVTSWSSFPCSSAKRAPAGWYRSVEFGSTLAARSTRASPLPLTSVTAGPGVPSGLKIVQSPGSVGPVTFSLRTAVIALVLASAGSTNVGAVVSRSYRASLDRALALGHNWPLLLLGSQSAASSARANRR